MVIVSSRASAVRAIPERFILVVSRLASCLCHERSKRDTRLDGIELLPQRARTNRARSTGSSRNIYRPGFVDPRRGDTRFDVGKIPGSSLVAERSRDAVPPGKVIALFPCGGRLGIPLRAGVHT